jgi:hypothetical protein
MFGNNFKKNNYTRGKSRYNLFVCSLIQVIALIHKNVIYTPLQATKIFIPATIKSLKICPCLFEKPDGNYHNFLVDIRRMYQGTR